MTNLPAPVQQGVLAEWEAWRARLELERWTVSRPDPEAAIRELVAREYFMPTQYRPKGHAHATAL